MGWHRWLAVLVVAGALVAPIRAQGTSGPRVSDSSVGYIDPAIPGDVFRFRFDASFDDTTPTRAEFIYPQGGASGPGLPEPERRINYEELSAYLELAACDQFSAFINVPVRFIQPEVNADHAGLSDLDAGFKFAFIDNSDDVATFQLRTYAPTGDARLGLGTRHVTLEPAFLLYNRLCDRLALESELRLWVPIGGTDYAGEIIRYGTGIHYDLYRTEHCTFVPVIEFVGWTVLDGKETVVTPAGLPEVQSAGGDTIVNAKVGLRVKFGDRADAYGGYGQALTGDHWYENTFRLEFRLLF